MVKGSWNATASQSVVGNFLVLLVLEESEL